MLISISFNKNAFPLHKTPTNSWTALAKWYHPDAGALKICIKHIFISFGDIKHLFIVSLDENHLCMISWNIDYPQALRLPWHSGRVRPDWWEELTTEEIQTWMMIMMTKNVMTTMLMMITTEMVKRKCFILKYDGTWWWKWTDRK